MLLGAKEDPDSMEAQVTTIDVLDQTVPTAWPLQTVVRDLSGGVHVCGTGGVSACEEVFATVWNLDHQPASKVTCVRCRQVLELGYAAR